MNDQYKTFNFAKIATAFILAIGLFITTAFNSGNAIAASNRSQTTYPSDDSNVEGLLYSNSDDVKSLHSVDDFVSPEKQKKLLDPTQIPAEKQPILDRSNPNAQLLEKTKQMFEDANNF